MKALLFYKTEVIELKPSLTLFDFCNSLFE